MSGIALALCLAGLVVGVLLYASPAVTPERYDIWMLFGIITLFAATPVSLLVLLNSADSVFRATRAKAPRSRLVAALWMSTAVLTAGPTICFVVLLTLYG